MVNENNELELTADDMYADGYIIEFPDGRKLLQRDKKIYRKEGANYKETIQGETLDTIAFGEYGSSKLWWNIADANSVFNPFVLNPGTGLILPQLIDTTNGL